MGQIGTVWIDDNKSLGIDVWAVMCWTHGGFLPTWQVYLRESDAQYMCEMSNKYPNAMCLKDGAKMCVCKFHLVTEIPDEFKTGIVRLGARNDDRNTVIG